MSDLPQYNLYKKKDQWALEKVGSQRATKKWDRKKDAVSQLRNTISEGSVRIHKEDGTIQEERTYPRRKDPKQSPG